jgi:hypothetical protein
MALLAISDFARPSIRHNLSNSAYTLGASLVTTCGVLFVFGISSLGYSYNYHSSIFLAFGESLRQEFGILVVLKMSLLEAL